MYVLDYLIYHLRPYGTFTPPEPLLPKLKVGETEPPPSSVQSTEMSKVDTKTV